eukprot:2973535-Amphidinium_carterae.1
MSTMHCISLCLFCGHARVQRNCQHSTAIVYVLVLKCCWQLKITLLRVDRHDRPPWWLPLHCSSRKVLGAFIHGAKWV